MSVGDRQADDLVNRGFIVNRPPKRLPGRGGRTFIVTGLHRSGTSLVAGVLREVGIFMGDQLNAVVHEDEVLAKMLIEQNFGALTHLIRERDSTYGTWGFKFPMLSKPLGPDELALFSDPHVIVPFRDPVSIAVRNSLSEYQQPMRALRTAVEEQTALLAFIERLECPSLLLSYEKSLVFPREFIETILRFCDLPGSDALCNRLIRLIEPNQQTYIAQVRRYYGGVIDGMSDGYLHGWCRLTAASEPVTLEMLVDDRLKLTFVADRFRQDLLDAGYGNGHHAFAIALRKFRLRASSIIRIKVAGQDVELENSGQRFDTYGV
jgi:hypothetical protein